MGKTIKALLYRGTPENPAFWKRVLLDSPYAAGEIECEDNMDIIWNATYI